MDISALLTPATARPAAHNQSAGTSKNASPEHFAGSLQKAIQRAPENTQQRDSQGGSQIPMALAAQDVLSNAELRQILSARLGDQEEALASEPVNGEVSATGLAPMAIPQGLAYAAPLQAPAADIPRVSTATAEAPRAHRSPLVTTLESSAATALDQNLALETEMELQSAAPAIHPRNTARAGLHTAAVSGQQLQPLEAPVTPNPGFESNPTVAANGEGATSSLPQPAALTTATSAQSPSAPATASFNSAIHGTTSGLNAALGSEVWGEEFSQHLLTMAHRGERQVDLHLHPRELGPLSVSLNLDDQGLRAQFLSANAAVRGAVEQALPQLRETLAQQGITLGETSVGQQQQQASQQQHAAPNRGDTSSAAAGSGAGSESVDGVQSTANTSLSAPATAIHGIDLYA